MEPTYERVVATLSEAIGIPQDRVIPASTLMYSRLESKPSILIRPESGPVEEIRADLSILTTLTIALETAFGLELTDEEAEELLASKITVQEIVAFIDWKRQT